MNKFVRPFDIVKDIINSCNLDISYFYDDLIFSDHNIFILQFDDRSPEVLNLYFNKECEFNTKISLKDNLYREAENRGMIMQDKGKFFLEEDQSKKEITIHYE